MKKPQNQRSNQRLYVLVRTDLDPSYRAVQAGHAVAEYSLYHDSLWDNGYLIYLGIKDENNLEKWAYKLNSKGIDYAEFREPDLGNQLTAIAAVAPGATFKKLRTI